MAVTSSAVGLAGCTGGEESTPTETVVGDTSKSDISGQQVHFLTQEKDGNYPEYWERLATDFEDETGAEVEIEFLGETGDAQERLIQLTQAGNPPEAAQLTMTWAAELGARGALADHSEVIDVFEEELGKLPEQYLVEFDGKKTFIPIQQNTHSKWYRTDLFDVEPNTWEKELEYASETDEGEGGMRGEWLSNSTQVLAPAINVFSRGWGNDAFVCQRNDDGEVKVVMDEEPYRSRWIEVLEHIQELQQYSPLNQGAGWTDLFDAMENGWASQIIMYGNRGKDQNNNDFVKDITNTNWPVPGDKFEEGGRFSWGNTAGYMTFQGSNEEAGKEFLKFWARQDYFDEMYMNNPGHNVPVLPDVYDDSDFQSRLDDALGPQWNYDEDIRSLHEMTKSSFDVPLETDPPNPYAGPLVGSLEMSELQIDVIINDMSIEDSIDEHATNMQEIIDDTEL